MLKFYKLIGSFNSEQVSIEIVRPCLYTQWCCSYCRMMYYPSGGGGGTPRIGRIGSKQVLIATTVVV